MCTYLKGNRPIEDVLYTQSVCLAPPGESGRCNNHPIDNPPSLPYNEECPFCLDEGGSILKCLHQVHVKCLMMANKLVCPICNDSLEYLPDVIKSTIAENRKKYLDEEVERERQEILEMEDFDIYAPRAEALAAIQYLTSINISFNNLIGIELNFDNSTPLPRGEIFRLVIKSIIEKLQDNIDSQLIEDDNEDELSFEIDTIIY